MARVLSKVTLIVFVALGTLMIASPAVAKEGGDQSAGGAESWGAGAVPPHGFYYIDYLVGYMGKLKDNNGDKVSLGGATPSVDVVGNCYRLLYVTKKKFLGADVAMHVIPCEIYQNVDLGAGAANMNSLADVDFNPFVLAWHKPSMHIAAGMDTFAPTGHYNKNDSRVSVGQNYWSFEPIFAISYLPKSRYDLSGKFMWNFKTTNNATNYHSGDDFHVDYVAGRHYGQWGLGADGYFIKQFTDDKVSGVPVAAIPGLYSEGRRGQVLAIGPSVTYATKNHIMFICQWQHETLVRNRFGGDKFWFKFIVPDAAFASLFRKHS